MFSTVFLASFDPVQATHRLIPSFFVQNLPDFLVVSPAGLSLGAHHARLPGRTLRVCSGKLCKSSF